MTVNYKTIFEIYNECNKYQEDYVIKVLDYYIYTYPSSFEMIEALNVLKVAYEKMPKRMFNDIEVYTSETKMVKMLKKYKTLIPFDWDTPVDYSSSSDYFSTETEVESETEYSSTNTDTVPHFNSDILPKNDTIENEYMSKVYNFGQKTFMFTGNLRKFGRNDVEAFIIKNNGFVGKSVNKQTDYLIVADDKPKKQTKIKLAKQKNVKILLEYEFYNLINQCESLDNYTLEEQKKKYQLVVDELKQKQQNKEFFNEVLHEINSLMLKDYDII